jgi:MFS family permease
MIFGLGLVSLATDMVADGARSVNGALLAQLGASALVVGLVTGGADAAALLLRLLTGPWADRTERYWRFTIIGYALTALSVPLLAVAPFAGSAGLTLASVLLIAERTGKAIRSPAKTVLLADATAAVGHGTGFGVHKTLDQLGAFLGPLLVAAVAAIEGSYWPAFLWLVIPAAAAMITLLRMRMQVPDTAVLRPRLPAETPPRATDAVPTEKTRATFVLFATFAALTTFGLIGFGVITFHLEDAGLVPTPAVPLVYGLATLAAALAALVTGRAYDRFGVRTLIIVPALTAFVPATSLAGHLPHVLIGVCLWGIATGIQDSTIKAFVADLVTPARRGTAFGRLAVFQGAAALTGGVTAGALYDHVALLTALVVIAQVVACVLLVLVLRSRKAPQ